MLRPRVIEILTIALQAARSRFGTTSYQVSSHVSHSELFGVVPSMIIDPIAMIPAPPIPLTTRPRMTVDIEGEIPLKYPVLVTGTGSKKNDAEVKAYQITHPSARRKYATNRIGLRPYMMLSLPYW